MNEIEKWEKWGYELIPESLSTTLSGGIGGNISHIGLGLTDFNLFCIYEKKDNESF